MKKILITGANSYIGISFENYMKQWPEEYQVDTIDMIDGTWRNTNFGKYNTVYHVAGIAHIKENKQNAHLFYNINRDLAVETVIKAKADGVKQFIYLSSMSIYGLVFGIITKDTVPNPKSNYGKSKLQAEMLIRELSTDDFLISIIRPPMVYGKGCKGNYQTLTNWATKLPIFPDFQNKRSMIEINVLCQFIKKLIDKDSSGIFYPQNASYVCTTEMVREIAAQNNHSIKLTRFFNPAIKVFRISIINKVFGDLIYKDME